MLSILGLSFLTWEPHCIWTPFLRPAHLKGLGRGSERRLCDAGSQDQGEKCSVFPVCFQTARPQVYTQRNPGRCHGNRSNSRELKLLDLARLTMHVTHSLPSCKSARTDPRLVQARRSRLSGDLEQITSSEPPACSRPPLPAQKIWTKENI